MIITQWNEAIKKELLTIPTTWMNCSTLLWRAKEAKYKRVSTIISQFMWCSRIDKKKFMVVEIKTVLSE